MAQILSIGRCTNLHLSSKGGTLLSDLERAGIDANRRTLNSVKILSAPPFPFPFCSPGMTLSGAEVEKILKL